MKLKLSTDYAIRIVVYLAIKNREISLKELCENIEIEQTYMIRFLKKLYRGGIVNISNKYMISLAKDSKQITMFDIIESIGVNVKIHYHLDLDVYGNSLSEEYLPIIEFYNELQDSIENILKDKTIYNLLKDKNNV